MDENEQNNFGFDGGDLSAHEQALINAVNQGKNLSQGKGSFSGGSFPASVQKSKKKGNLFGSLTSSFAKSAAAFAKDDSGGNSGTSSSLAMLDRTFDTGAGGGGTTTKQPAIISRTAGRAAAASASISDGVKGLGGANSSVVMTPFQRQELLILNRIKDDVSEIADLLKDIDGKPSTKGTTDILKGQKEGKQKESSLLNNIGNFVKELVPFITTAVAAVSSVLGGVLGPVGGLISKTISTARNLVVDAAKGTGNAAKNTFNAVRKNAPKVANTARKAARYARTVGKNVLHGALNAAQRAHNASKSPTVRRIIRGTVTHTGRAYRAAKATARNISRAAKAVTRPVVATAKFAYGTAKKAFGGTKNTLGFFGRMAQAAGNFFGVKPGTASKISLPKIAGKFAGKFFNIGSGVLGAASGVIDNVNTYNNLQKHNDMTHRIGAGLEIGLNTIGAAALASSEVSGPAGAVIYGATQLAKKGVQGWVAAPSNKRWEGFAAESGNWENDTAEKFRNTFTFQDKSKSWWDPRRYMKRFETTSQLRDDVVTQLENSGKHDKNTMAKIKEFKSMQLGNNETYHDKDFSLGNVVARIKEINSQFNSHPSSSSPPSYKKTTASSSGGGFGDEDWGNATRASLPNATNVLQNSKSAASKGVAITAPLTQTFSVVFNNTKVESESDVKKWVDQILRQEHQAADMAKRANERFSNLNSNTLSASKGIAINPARAMG